jgi:hypothetical protein
MPTFKSAMYLNLGTMHVRKVIHIFDENAWSLYRHPVWYLHFGPDRTISFEAKFPRKTTFLKNNRSDETLKSEESMQRLKMQISTDLYDDLNEMADSKASSYFELVQNCKYPGQRVTLQSNSCSRKSRNRKIEFWWLRAIENKKLENRRHRRLLFFWKVKYNKASIHLRMSRKERGESNSASIHLRMPRKGRLNTAKTDTRPGSEELDESILLLGRSDSKRWRLRDANTTIGASGNERNGAQTLPPKMSEEGGGGRKRKKIHFSVVGRKKLWVLGRNHRIW